MEIGLRCFRDFGNMVCVGEVTSHFNVPVCISVVFVSEARECYLSSSLGPILKINGDLMAHVHKKPCKTKQRKHTKYFENLETLFTMSSGAVITVLKLFLCLFYSA